MIKNSGFRSLVTASGAALVAGVLFSCTGPDTPPDLVIEPTKATPVASPDSPVAMLQRLGKVTASSEKLNRLVADVRLMLEAQADEESGDVKAAVKKWYDAMLIAQNSFGDFALKNWVRSYAVSLDKKVDEQVMAKLLLAETRGGYASQHLTTKGLINEQAMAVYIRGVIPEYLDTPPPDTPVTTGTAPGTGMPKDDPLLKNSAQTFCGIKDESQKTAWQKWTSSFSALISTYWQALVLECSGKAGEALASYLVLFPKLAEKKDTQNLAAEAVARAVKLQRQIAKREDAADTYNEVVRIWQMPGVTADRMGLKPADFQLEKINQILWASRYRALIGDYENAKLHSQLALTQIANTYAVEERMEKKARDTLAEYRAEAYHILAYRISVENKDFDGALALNLLALQTPGLNDEWNDRLQWFAGLYDFLGGNFESAKKRWEKLLNQTKDDTMKPMLFFWLARAYDKLGQSAESRFYLSTVAEDYPLSFYATVAPTISNLVPDKDWREIFSNLPGQKSRLANGDGLNVEKHRASPRFGNRLLRAEVLSAAQVNPFTVMAISELESAITSESTVEASEDLLTYVTRLYFANGEYLRNIGLTTKLMRESGAYWKRHPEQIFVYFPSPYSDIYERSANENVVDRNLLLAVSRQESGFTRDIRSSANAIGLMQLIPPTARTYAAELGLEAGDIESRLLNPEYNIRVGSRYLKKLTLQYKGFFPAVFGGYNGGEAAMDMWMKRRYHADPLTFVELIPFNETKGYVKNVWRNLVVYNFLARALSDSSELKMSPGSGEATDKFRKFDQL
jgi:soluble lytic murein transglycosylase-like protein